MEEDDPTGMYEAGEEKSIVMRVPKPMPPPKGESKPAPIASQGESCLANLHAYPVIPRIVAKLTLVVSSFS